ncbi:DUF2169 domain-containing protein [Pseudomonas chlororaphis]|uniref:Type VI secretion-associated pentapeptide repeat protein, TagAB family n=1 Tax=Pseudomonas chlororaphis O6 TaxID=1037915 RepID=A0AB33X1Q5_9PSED|nr:pentapeptide repeat-containing protein [Pseudomonas chlororaphis]EIM18972.1 type VI secretion-associated pentapeptide repeat protein, TagAB family [Pseudomonas chlororaphis O6]
MRVIRPQQLIAIKGTYQIGRESRLGISVIAGCYLSRPEHFVNEAQIWDAWKRAPLSFPVLDAAEPKPFAEYLIAGHAGIGQPVEALDVSAQVGALSRQWRVEGQGRRDALGVTPFIRMAMDHPSTWGGQSVRENPLGRGHQDGLNPLLMSMAADRSVQERSPLAAPTPLPYEFAARKMHIDKVAPLMADKAYLRSIFPALPASIDPRYFQMAAPPQWLPLEAWPDRVPFALQGFGPDTISGVLPQVHGRAFVRRHGEQVLEEVVLRRKTLWFFPDSDMALLIYTGSVALEHLLDESFESLLVALDRCDAPRSSGHFHQVHKQRSDEQASGFACLLDTNLMPEGMGLNITRSLREHPDSSRYEAAPTSAEDSAGFYQRIREAIATHEQPDAQEVDQPALPAITGDPEVDLFNDAPDTVQERNFTGLRFSGTLVGKTFQRCNFVRCDFSLATLKDCVFEQCLLQASNLSKATLQQVRLVECALQQLDLSDSHLREVRLEKVNLQELSAQRLHVENGVWDACVFDGGSLIACCFYNCTLANNLFSGTDISRLQVDQGQIDACVFNRCDARGVNCDEVLFNKNSLLGGDWGNARFFACQISYMTAGLHVDFSHAVFSECSLNKVGFKQVGLHGCHLLHCAFSESNFDQADLSAATISACDMAGARFKDAVLSHSRWRDTSLQQGMLYNADLRDATFDQCNLASANLAMAWQDASTAFNGCLSDRACWVPSRLLPGELAHGH